MNIPFISVIIPNWNGRRFLYACLFSLKNQTHTNFETIMVDNGSTDGSVEFVRLKYPEVKIIAFTTNLGFAKAVNEGIKESQGKYVVLLNNDMRIEKDWLKSLANAIKGTKFAAVTSKIILMDGKLDSAGDTMNSVGQAFHLGHGDDPDKWDKPREQFLVTAGATIYKTEAFKKIGLFDEDFFAYGEDVDWCLRGQLLGYRFFYDPTSVVYHYSKGTGRKISKYVEYLQFRNMVLTIIKNFPWQLFLKRWRFITIPLVHFNTILYMTFHGLLKEALWADFWILTHLPQILKARWDIQKTRKVTIGYFDSQMEPKKIRLWGLIK